MLVGPSCKDKNQLTYSLVPRLVPFCSTHVRHDYFLFGWCLATLLLASFDQVFGMEDVLSSVRGNRLVRIFVQESLWFYTRLAIGSSIRQ